MTQLPESWLCVDCGFNTAPGCLNQTEAEKFIQDLGDKWGTNEEGIPMEFNENSEVYTVREKVWKEAGMEDFGGCLCIGCLEKRIGRRLRPKDFNRNHPFADLPGTERLLKRQGRA